MRLREPYLTQHFVIHADGKTYPIFVEAASLDCIKKNDPDLYREIEMYFHIVPGLEHLKGEIEE